jgi:D-lyxose ketol-isomerase
MKRSEINALMKRAEAFIEECGFHLPPFARWSPEDWAEKGEESDEIRKCRLGWDITDFGRGDFMAMGLILFTLRNGTPDGLAKGGKSYAEKLMIVEAGQVTPCHFHWQKREDIINRAGVDLMIQVWGSDAREALSEEEVTLSLDGVRRTFQAGAVIGLKPGESITLEPRIYHAFWAEKGRCLIGEVSSVNDDDRDNRFLETLDRFSAIEEDEPPRRYLCNEYPPAS